MVAVNNQGPDAMASITLKNIPEKIHERRKQRARLNRRSLQQEIMACLERTVLPRKVDPEEILGQVREVHELFEDEMRIGEIDKAIREGRP